MNIGQWVELGWPQSYFPRATFMTMTTTLDCSSFTFNEVLLGTTFFRNRTIFMGNRANWTARPVSRSDPF